MTDMLVRVRNPRESVLEIEHVAISPPTSAINNDAENHIKRANEELIDAWYDLYDWVEFNKESRKVFCKNHREGGGKFVQVRVQLMLKFQHFNTNLKIINIKNCHALNMGTIFF